MRIGEIVETNSAGFVAESFELNAPPRLGSLVEVVPATGERLYAVVAFGETVGVEPGRRAMRRSDEKVYDAAIYDEHPQIKLTLRTVFRALLVGWEDGGRLRQSLPPQPPPLHYSVHACEAPTVRGFTDRLYYLRLLVAAPADLPIAQLVAAHLSEVYRQRALDRAWLQGAAREVASLLTGDHAALMGILYAIDPD